MNKPSASAEFGPGVYPLWFWNDRLERDEVRWQIAEMARQGIKGFYIHPRQGMAQPYLSDAFFEMVEVALDAAEEHGLSVHLCDEFPYPSGNAGGAVAWGDPSFCLTRLVQQSDDVEGGSVQLVFPQGGLLSCVAYPFRGDQVDWSSPIELTDAVGTTFTEESFVFKGLTRYSPTRYFASKPMPTLEVELPLGRYRVVASVQAPVENFKYWGKAADLMNSAAVRRFLEMTHDRYHARFGNRFGKTLKSFFVDEVAPGWTPKMPEQFERCCGYPLIPVLPALCDPTHPRHIEVSKDYHRVKYEMFCESYEAPVSEWCRTHGVQYVADKHLLRLSQSRFTDLPGCDPGHFKAGARPDVFGGKIRKNARAIASAAYFYGKFGCACECYHSMGWGTTLQDAKLVAESLVFAGITHLIPHGFFYSTHGLRKHDAPPSFFFQTPAWPHFGRLTERLGRLWAAMASTHIDASVLIVEPTPGLPTAEMEATYEQLQAALLDEHIDFLMVDTDVLERAELHDGSATIQDISARVIVVPPMRVHEPELEAWLDRFQRLGGEVIWVNGPNDVNELASRIGALVQPSIMMRSLDEATLEGVWATRRVAAGRRLWMLLNTTDRTREIAISEACELSAVGLDDVEPLITRSGREWRLTLRPFESVLLESDRSGRRSATPVPEVVVPLDGDATFVLRNVNLLRLGDWELSIAETGQAASPPVRVKPAPVINQIAESAAAIVPAVTMFFGGSPALSLRSLQLSYAATFQRSGTAAVSLVMEPHSIRGRWSIRVNNQGQIEATDFKPAVGHVRGAVGCDITHLLRDGANQLVLFVETDRLDGGLLNSLYLAGSFGVTLNPLGIAPLRDEGRFGALDSNGLPFFAGVIEYTMSLPTPATLPTGGEVRLRIDPGFEYRDALAVSFADGVWRAVPWEPRVVSVPAAELRNPAGTFKVRQYSTLSRAFDAQVFDEKAHTSRNVGGEFD